MGVLFVSLQSSRAHLQNNIFILRKIVENLCEMAHQKYSKIVISKEVCLHYVIQPLLKGIPRKLNACKGSYRYPDRKAVYVSPQKSFPFPRSQFSNARYREKHLDGFQFYYPTIFKLRCWRKRLQIFVIVRRLVIGEF